MRRLIFFLLVFLFAAFQLKAQKEIKLNFSTPDSALLPAMDEYSRIWKEESNRIISVMERISGMQFIDTAINVIIIEAPSNSGNNIKDPLRLRASYSFEMKQATLVHELGHRLQFSVQRRPENFNDHNLLFLYLYDVWVELYGEEKAKKAIEVENRRSNASNNYKGMWDIALAMTKEERARKLKDHLASYR